MTPIQKTCTCIKDLLGNNFLYMQNHEYQVDIYPNFYKIYNNGGWVDYIYIDDEKKFNEYFKMIL